MPIVLVTGSPGAGKSTLMESVKGFKNIQVLNYGDLLIEFGREKGYIKNADSLKAHDELRFLEKKPEVMEEMQTYAFTKISKMKGDILLDTHAVIKADKRYMPGFPQKYLKLLTNLVGLIYIDVTTETVIERRKSDTNRDRMERDALEIDAQRILNMATLSYLSTYFCIPLYVLENKQGKLDEAKALMKKSVGELFKV